MEKLDEKLNVNATDAIMCLPPSPVLLLAVGGDTPNVTTMSMFNVFSIDPAIVGIGIKSSRYSYKLLEETADFSLNIPGREILDKVIKCGETSGSKLSKFSEIGLTPVKGKRISSPTILECPLNIEVKKLDQTDRGDWDHIWYYGNIVHTDVDDKYDRSNYLTYGDGEFRTSGPILKRM